MTDKKISELTLATTIVGVDLFTDVQGGENKKVTATTTANFIATSQTYASLNTASKILTGAINEVYQWNRTFLDETPFLTPRHIGDGLLFAKGFDTLSYLDGSLSINNTNFNTELRIDSNGQLRSYFAGSLKLPNIYSSVYDNLSNDTDMVGTENGHIFRQTYYDAVSPISKDEGYFGFGAETDWSSVASTWNSYAVIRTSSHGSLINAFKLSSIGALTLKDTIQIGTIDALGYSQIWNPEPNAVIRLGSAVGLGIGHLTNTPAIGVRIYGANAQGDAMSDTNFSGSSLKPTCLNFFNVKDGLNKILFNIDTSTNEFYLRDNLGVKTFDFDRLLGILTLKSGIKIGLIDAFSRTQFWNYESNSVIRLGSLAQDGDVSNISSEGSVFYGQNAQGDAMSSLDWGYARIKPYRIGLYNAKNSGYVGYLFRLDTQTNEFYLRDNLGVKTFDFNRATSALTVGSAANNLNWSGTVQTNTITGSVGLNSSALKLVNLTDDLSLITTSTSVDLYQRTHAGTIVDLGQLQWMCESSFTTDALSQRNSRVSLKVVKNGVLTDGISINANLAGTLSGIFSYDFAPSFTQGSNQLATVGYVDSKAGAKTPITEELTISSNGQAAFTLAQTPYNATYVNTFLNGQRRRYSVDFTVSGTALTWNDPGGLTLKTTDSPLIVTYEY